MPLFIIPAMHVHCQCRHCHYHNVSKNKYGHKILLDVGLMQFIFLFSEADINLSLNTERPRCITYIVVFFETTTLIYPKIRKSLYYGRLLTVEKNSRTLITTNCIKEKSFSEF